MSAARRLAVIAVAACAVACGRKGPPLAPLHLIPVAPANISIGRVGSEVHVRFDVPSTNVNGPGPAVVDRVEVFAATVAAGAIRPPNRDLLLPKYRVATIAIKPPPVEGEAPPENVPGDTRPSAGERTTFAEQLTDDRLKPVFTTMPKPSALPGAGTVVLPGTPSAPPSAPGAAGVEPVAAPTAPVAPPPEQPASRRFHRQQPRRRPERPAWRRRRPCLSLLCLVSRCRFRRCPALQLRHRRQFSLLFRLFPPIQLASTSSGA